MRNMSFSLTTQAMIERRKTVTRRLGWSFLKPGDIVMAVEKAMGLKKGEKIKRLYPIRIVSVRREMIGELSGFNIWATHYKGGWELHQEMRKEGFPHMLSDDFIEMFCDHNGCTPSTDINRIEFEEVR